MNVEWIFTELLTRLLGVAMGVALMTKIALAVTNRRDEKDQKKRRVLRHVWNGTAFVLESVYVFSVAMLMLGVGVAVAYLAELYYFVVVGMLAAMGYVLRYAGWHRVMRRVEV